MLPILRVLYYYKISRVVILSYRYILHKSIATVLSYPILVAKLPPSIWRSQHVRIHEVPVYYDRNDLLTIEPGLSVWRHPTKQKEKIIGGCPPGDKQAAKLESSMFDPVAWLRGSRFAGALAQVSLTGRSLGDVFPWECSRCAVECT